MRLRPPVVLRVLLILAPAFALETRMVGAQTPERCELGCAAVLGLSSAALATGTSVLVGRLNGGFATTRSGVLVWTGGLGLGLGGALALSDDGKRRRAVYAGGVGIAVGSLAGLVVASLSDEPSVATRLSATLIGAALGSLVGGVYGVMSYDDGGASGGAGSATLPLWSIQLHF